MKREPSIGQPGQADDGHDWTNRSAFRTYRRHGWGLRAEALA